MLQALFLDFGDTLARESPSRHEIYAREARAAGAAVDERGMRTLMARAHAELPVEIDGAYRYSDPWFEAYIERIFHGYLGLARQRLATLRKHLFEHFSDAATFRLFPGARDLLDAARGAGLKLGLVSNWSVRLPQLVERLGLAPQLDVVVCSAIERCEKPGRAIFELALERAGVDAAAALHAGDSPTKDAAGARSAGLATVLVDHTGKMAPPDGVPVVRSLDELRAHVLQHA